MFIIDTYTVKGFGEFTNKLIELFQWIMISMISFVENAAFIFLICNELSCIDQGNQWLIITNTINIITIQRPSNFNVFLYVCNFKNLLQIIYQKYMINSTD